MQRPSETSSSRHTNGDVILATHTIRGREFLTYNENGTTYLHLQNVKDAFFKDISYSAFRRRKNKVATSDQPTPTVVEYCRRNGILGLKIHRASSLSTRQVEMLLEQLDDGDTLPMTPATSQNVAGAIRRQ